MSLSFKSLSIQNFLSAFYKEYADFQPENKQEFKDKLESYKQKYEQNKNQNEPAIVANALAPFFESLGFHAQSAYKHKGNSEIDLALLKDSNVEILIEAKKPDSPEMFSPNKPNCKALHECILYYLRERENNTSLKYIILTDFLQFYIFSAREFERHFSKHKGIQKAYKSLMAKDLLQNQKDFYDEISKFLNKDFAGVLEGDLFNTTLQGTFFDLRNDKHLNIAHKILTRDFLHREYKLDSNALNPRFYKELLYILGLKEFDKGGKITIEFDDAQEKSFAKHIAYKLESSNKPSDFEAVMGHILLWLNRILFLKLIEANLLHFNDFDKDLQFLSSDKIINFNDLNNLFFEVLAKDYEKRENATKFHFLPYLNSSLFIRDEKLEILTINDLSDDLEIKIFESTQATHKKGENCKFLTYLLDFLNAFDFGKRQEEQGDSTHKDLIRSSVLGAVFEKLNGYKEGSFYTPSFITNYMCRESLQKVVIERFNAAFEWSAQSLEDLRKRIDREFEKVESQAKQVLQSIRICDPSVGSGHFLVSALNEMIYIYHRLGLLGISYKDLQIQDDEIYLTTKEGEKFAYKRLQDSNHEIQQALFELKKSIIENNLFGVDINPNSCNIARLRLWIELLKNAYYLNFSKDKDSKIHKLQTLPNIDINIKCGNSLISYFDMNSSLSHYPNIAAKMQEYKQIVQNYKEGFYDNKAQIDRKIKDLLQAFRNFCFKDKFKKQTKDFETKCEEYSKKYGNFLAKEDKDLSLYVPQRMFIEDFDENEAKKEFQILQNAYNELFNLESNNPLEWRFAFPEVLDSNGDFLGFDLVIGNPPYIRQEEIKELKPHLQKAFSIYKGTSDIYTYFFELGFKILRENGILSFITSNKWCRAGYGEPLREFLLENTSLQNYIDLNGIKVFESASVDTSILQFIKAKAEQKHTLKYANPKAYNPKDNKPLEESLELTEIPQDSLSKESFIFTSPEVAALKAKIEKIGTPLKEWDINIYRGILTGCNDVKVNGKKEGVFIITSEKRAEILSTCDNSKNSLKPYLAFEYDENLAEMKRDLEVQNGFLILNEKERTEQIIKPLLRGQDIKRYSYKWANLWLIHTRNSYLITNEKAKGFGLKIKDFRQRKRDEVNHIEIPAIDIEEYPALKAHFDEVANKGSSKGKGFYNRDDKGITPYNLRNCAYLNEFAKPKIVYSEIVREPQFYLDNGEFKFGYFYAEATSFILSGNKNFKSSLEYLLGLLHSKLCTFAFKEFYAGGGLGESGYRYKKAFLENLPIPHIDSKQEAEFIVIVREIIECKKSLRDSNTQSRPSDNLPYGNGAVALRGLRGIVKGEKGENKSENLPLSPLTKADEIAHCVKNKNETNTTLESLESRLDSMVFSLYNLNNDEIKLIESLLSSGGG